MISHTSGSFKKFSLQKQRGAWKLPGPLRWGKWEMGDDNEMVQLCY